ncbi:MAG: RNA methyltransferase [Candidatus Moraniibacteriota bacterium]
MTIQKIISKDNEKIKYLKKLREKKVRDETGQFLVENLIIISDAIKSGFLPQAVFICEEFLEDQNDKLEYVMKNTKEHFIIDNKLNKYFSSLITPSGIAAVFDKKSGAAKLSNKIIYLNAINDPGNLGTILRTAVAFDLESIVLDEKCVDIYNSKTISAAKDAIFKLNFFIDKDLKIFKKIKTNTKIYATSLDGDKLKGDLFGEENFCLVFGNEANGVDQEIISQADKLIKIPIGEKIESLNVSVAAGIIFYLISSEK